MGAPLHPNDSLSLGCTPGTNLPALSKGFSAPFKAGAPWVGRLEPALLTPSSATPTGMSTSGLGLEGRGFCRGDQPRGPHGALTTKGATCNTDALTRPFVPHGAWAPRGAKNSSGRRA